MRQHTNQSVSLLSSSTSVPWYWEMEKSRNVNGIAEFIGERFSERYIAPFDENCNKNGFIMMASSCLMIEALESFWQGWEESPRSSKAFSLFFHRNQRFSSIRSFSREFYKHVRCGIMHQGETTGGWHIRRDSSVLFDAATRTINATTFLKEMEGSLYDYCIALSEAAWDSEQWQNLRKKMEYVCANTRPLRRDPPRNG